MVELGRPGGQMDANDDLARGPIELITDLSLSDNNPNNPAHTAGTTFMGQFLDHDMTRDAGSRLGRPTPVGRSTNLRSASFDLDSLYGAGPIENAAFYESDDPIVLRVESGGRFGAARGEDAGPTSLATRNLLRHITWEVPSGQRIAERMNAEPLSSADLSDLSNLGANLDRSTPLWFYILREADVFAEGLHLGPVGGRIVAEVFFSALQNDPNSYLAADPDWQLVLPTLDRSAGFNMTDLLPSQGWIRSVEASRDRARGAAFEERSRSNRGEMRSRHAVPVTGKECRSFWETFLTHGTISTISRTLGGCGG